MPKFAYTPDEDLKVEKKNAINLICKGFQSHESGLPEWLKNSADAYVRDESPPEQRVIVVAFSSGAADAGPSISVLDYAGMTSTDIEEHFRHWASTEAATRGSASDGVQGGHGNGGKCYMTQMFDDYGYIHTIREDKGCKYGVAGGSILFGYIPDPSLGKDFDASDMTTELQRALREIGLELDKLPEDANSAFELAIGFTLVSGVAPKGYSNGIPAESLADMLSDHPQMITTLELCKIFVIADGEPMNGGLPLELPQIPPIKGAEEDRIAMVPRTLIDPQTDEKLEVPKNDDGKRGLLTLRTSKVNMRSAKRKMRHNVIFRTADGYIGYVEVAELDVQSSYREKIYGELHLDALEPFKQNDRTHLAKSPLTRAVQAFISAQVQIYAKEFEKLDSTKYNQEEKAELSRINEALDRWKNDFLKDYMEGLWGEGIGLPPPPRPPLPSGKTARIDVHLSHGQAGVGISLLPTTRFFDQAGARIRANPIGWISDDTNVAIVDEELHVISTFSPGITRIHAQSLDGSVVSNVVALEVVEIESIRIEPTNADIPEGSKIRFDAVCTLRDSTETRGAYLIWTESDPTVVRVSPSGMAYALSRGEANIVAGDDRVLSTTPAEVAVVEGIGAGRGGKRGTGYPQVLVSGEFDRDPETEEFAYFSEDDPPVHQRVQDVERNIWWINSASPLAQMYLDKDQRYGYKSRAWRMYHLERYIDIIVQIALTHGPMESEEISVNEWIVRWGMQVADIAAAAVADLSLFIAEGDLPESP